MNVLLSIKPEYAEMILNGDKTVELRRVIFKEDVDRVYLYATYPIKRVVGYFIISDVFKDRIANLWSKFRGYCGIDSNEFFKYFIDKEYGYAIEIKESHRISKPIELNEIQKELTPPRSFCYINHEMPSENIVP